MRGNIAVSTLILGGAVAVGAILLATRDGTETPRTRGATRSVDDVRPLLPAFPIREFAPAETDLSDAAAMRLRDEPPIPYVDPDPDELRAAASSFIDRHELNEWDIAARASTLEREPTGAFAFVRDAIGFDPYPGVLRGPDGTMSAGGGNAWDRALLLRALLQERGFVTRLAVGTLDEATAAAVVERSHRRSAGARKRSQPSDFITALAPSIGSRARRDDAALRLALDSRLAALDLDERPLARQDVSMHAWVQISQDGTWVDLDPTLPQSRVGHVLAAPTGTLEDVPDDRRHKIALRVVSEVVADGSVSSTVVLERVLDAATAANRHILLSFVPTGGGGPLLGTASSADMWVPTLSFDEEAEVGAPVPLAVAGRDTGGLNVFGGGDAPETELRAIFLDVEVRVPGRGSKTARHLLVGRHRGAEDPAADEGLLLRQLRRFHHILISTGGINSLSLAELRAEALEVGLADEPSIPGDSLDAFTWPLWSADLSLVEGSERLIVAAMDAMEGVRAFVAEPRIYLTSWGPEHSRIDGTSRETDLLLDSLRVLDGSGVAGRTTRLQLYYGALQSALETETTLQLAVGWDPDGRRVTSTSLAMTADLAVLPPSDADDVAASAPPALTAALRAGHYAVVPGDESNATAWWTIAPNGFARAMLIPGTGGSGVSGPRAPSRPPGGGRPPREPKPEAPKPPPNNVNPTDKSRMHERPPRRRRIPKPKPTPPKPDDKKKNQGNEYQTVQQISGQVTRKIADGFDAGYHQRMTTLIKVTGS